MKTKVNIVPHTHWDAEWYFTVEDTNVLLMNNMWDVINKLKKVEYPFTWDGQVYPIQQFLNVENSKDAIELMKKNKLIIGPWYTQPNARQILGENYFRNLEHGVQLTKEFGQKNKHALMSDIFGFADQVPQVLKKNGVETAIFMRGWDPKTTKGKNEFKWISPSNHDVFAKVPQQGYGNAKFLGKNNQVDKKFIQIKNDDLNNTISKVSLLLNGGDQMYFRNNLNKLLKSVKSDESEWSVTGLDEYVANVKKSYSLKKKNMVNYKGEITAPIGQRIHLTAYSQRQDINNLISELEYKIVYEVEPLNVILHKYTKLDYSNLIYKAWESLFLSTAHDAAAGCNSDETNSAILSRLNSANQSIDSIIEIIKKTLNEGLGENKLRIFATNFIDEDIIVKTFITTNKKDFLVQDHKKKRVPLIIKKSKKLSMGKRIEVTPKGEREISLGNYYLHEVELYIKNAKAMSLLDLDIIECKKINSEKSTLDLNNLKIKIYANNGDSYDFSPSDNNFSELHNLKLKNIKGIKQSGFEFYKKTFTLSVFEDYLIRNKKVKAKFILLIIKNPLGDYDFNLTIGNKSKNAKISLIIGSKKVINKILSRTIFYEKEYSNKSIPNNWPEIYREKPVNVFPFVGSFTTNEITFASRQLREVSYKSKIVEITLMRSNGKLGKDNLKWRPGRASGVNDHDVLTPDAQMIKNVNLTFSLIKGNKREKVNKALVNYGALQSNLLAKHTGRIQRFFMPKTKIKSIQYHIDIPKGIEVQSLYRYKGKTHLRLLNITKNKTEKQIVIENIKRKVKFNPWEIQTIVF